MKMDRKTALICVDLQKNLTVEGGGNYYPTATEMIDRVARRINEFRDRGVQIVYIWSMPHLSSGLCSNGPKLNPELAGRMVPQKRNLSGGPGHREKMGVYSHCPARRCFACR